MPSEENFTNMRVRRDTLTILKRYASIHHLSAPRFLDNLASLLVCGIDNLDNTELTVDDLRKLYRYSSLMVAQDMRKVCEPVREPAQKSAVLEVPTHE